MHRKRRGQSTLEYIVLLTIVMGAFLAVSAYFKRGIQGRWKDAIDEFGDQYDPRVSNGNIRHTLISNSEIQIRTINVTNGQWTIRTDFTNSLETKTGSITVGGYDQSW